MTAPALQVRAPLALQEFEQKLRSRDLRVAVVGFGYVGTCIGAVLASRGFSVTGVDPDAGIVEGTNAGRARFSEPRLAELVGSARAVGRICATSDIAAVAASDVALVTVGTPLLDGSEPDLGQVRAAIGAMAPHLNPGHLVILKSTAPPRTTEAVVAPALAAAGRTVGEIYLAFCPERLAEGSAIADLTSIPVVVSGVDEASRERATVFWREAVGVPTISVSNTRTAEMVKLASNLWIDLNIALGNELAKLCDRVGVDVLEVIEAANSLPKGHRHVNILTPSMGVGGSCLTKDPWFVDHLGKQYGLRLQLPAVGRAVNDSMPSYTVSIIADGLGRAGKRLAESRVAVLGLAFKTDTGDCRSTPTKPAIAALAASGCRLVLCDPLVSAEDARSVSSVPLTPHIEDAVRGADCVAFFTGHRIFREFSIMRLAELAPGALVVDGRMYFTPGAIADMRAHGLAYRGVGR
jgi:UDP-N-acetyl-D-mannosaminuronic acid dehydrogenase